MKYLDLYADLRGEHSDDIHISGQGLTTLIGCPDTVYGRFLAKDNELETLEGAPKYVTGIFVCSYNRLKNLIGAPEVVDGTFDCSYNNIITLEGCPKQIGGIFKFEGNPNPHLGEEWKYRKTNIGKSEEEIRVAMFLSTESEFYASQEIKDIFLF